MNTIIWCPACNQDKFELIETERLDKGASSGVFQNSTKDLDEEDTNKKDCGTCGHQLERKQQNGP